LRPDGPERPALRYRDGRSDHWKHARLGALTLSVLSTVLIYVIIPVAAVLIIAALAMAGSDRSQRRRRYRPGRPYDFQPVWFLASPEQVNIDRGGSGPDRRALHHHEPHAIEGPLIEDMSGALVRPGPTGGASDRW
jgi:hypothetical protein